MVSDRGPAYRVSRSGHELRPDRIFQTLVTLLGYYEAVSPASGQGQDDHWTLVQWLGL